MMACQEALKQATAGPAWGEELARRRAPHPDVIATTIPYPRVALGDMRIAGALRGAVLLPNYGLH